MTHAIFSGLTTNLHNELTQYRAETRAAYVHDLISADDRELVYAAIHLLKLATRRAERAGAPSPDGSPARTSGETRARPLNSEGETRMLP